MFKFLKPLFTPKPEPEMELKVGECYQLYWSGAVVKITNLEENGKIVYYSSFPIFDFTESNVVSADYFKRLYRPL